MDHVKVKKRELVHEGTIIDVYKDVVVLPNGGIETWDYVEHKKGAAAVVPVTVDGKILLVRQYRPALERYTWELPAGTRDDVNEDYLETAKRELLEETGYMSNDIIHLMSLQTTVAFCNEPIEVYLASECFHEREQHLDDAEQIEVKEWEVPVLMEMISTGELQDAKTVAGISAYKAFSIDWQI